MQSKHGKRHVSFTCENPFVTEGMAEDTPDRNRIQTRLSRHWTTMKKVVKIIPHHGGKPLNYDILTDTGCAISLVSADLASFCGKVNDSNGPGRISTSFHGFVKACALDCSGLVSFDVQYEGRWTGVEAWVSPSIHGELWLSYQTLGWLGIIPEAFPVPPLERRLPLNDKDSDVEEVVPPKQRLEIVDLVTSDPGEDDEDGSGDPEESPEESAEREIQPGFLAPFYFGWRREVVFRQAITRTGIQKCDIYYIPPRDGRYHTRGAQRKQHSKRDLKIFPRIS